LTTTGTEENKEIPHTFSLSQNYPNPFNPNTIIKYQIPDRCIANIKVYDELGRVVAELINEEKAAGGYEVKFDGKNLSSGVYYYQLRAGSFIETKKLVLLK
ncbi:MAG: T9SS type A sorting domain-containing protein, partial [Bacteroidetes bacterium]|nr:T9SS type A sorting domain-containing protein [Bacteroidota bacterium]